MLPRSSILFFAQHRPPTNPHPSDRSSCRVLSKNKKHSLLTWDDIYVQVQIDILQDLQFIFW